MLRHFHIKSMWIKLINKLPHFNFKLITLGKLHLTCLTNLIKRCTCGRAALTLSSSVSLVACMSRVSSSDILSAVWLWISSSRALSFSTHKIYMNITTSLKLLMDTPPFWFSCCWPVRCGPVVRPRDPASPLCSQHPPAGHRHPIHCRGTPGSGPEASRSLLPSESKIQKI